VDLSQLARWLGELAGGIDVRTLIASVTTAYLTTVLAIKLDRAKRWDDRGIALYNHRLESYGDALGALAGEVISAREPTDLSSAEALLRRAALVAGPEVFKAIRHLEENLNDREIAVCTLETSMRSELFDLSKRLWHLES